MAEPLSHFSVLGLHGSRTMDLPLLDNRLILVGENGTGKSTFVNLMYYFLTRQWTRLTSYQFTRIQARFGEQELVLTPEHVEQHLSARQHLGAFLRVSRHSTPLVTHRLLDQLMDVALHDPSETDAELTERLAIELRIPVRVVRDMLDDYMRETKGKPTHLQTLEHLLQAKAPGQFLYLPTYRRIEQDLRSIFRGADVDSDLRKLQDRLTRRSGKYFIELVEFGMEDVERTIVERMAQIKENVRNGLNNLTGTYLRDVIRGVYADADLHQVAEFDPTTLDILLARIDEVTLPQADKEHLKQRLAAFSASGTIGERDKVIAHFLSKLIEFYGEQQANESQVRAFVERCNQYLTDKRLVYDNIGYTLFVAQDRASDDPALPMSALSSGEKQIVSLFSHLYLSGETNFFVMIDEPELSLSVPWQRRFLPDIVASGMCTGLVAVTHSPFVWDNELEPYVRPLAEFTSSYTASSTSTRRKPHL